jgi:hypothetical protein
MTARSRLHAALLNRISDHGWIDIRVSRLTLAALLEDIGHKSTARVVREIAEERSYSVPAVLLETLVNLAGRSPAPAMNVLSGSALVWADPTRGPASEPPVHRDELSRQCGDPEHARVLRRIAACLPKQDLVTRIDKVFVAWRGMVWASVNIRKPAVCVVTGAAIPPGASAWRQLSEVKGRDERVSAAAWEGLV